MSEEVQKQLVILNDGEVIGVSSGRFVYALLDTKINQITTN